MVSVVMLTTVDNPHDPFDDYDQWLAWDLRAGYNTNSLLARFTISSDDLSEADQQADLESAMEELVDLNPLAVHKIVRREIEDEKPWLGEM